MAPINFGFGRTSRIGKLIKKQITDVPTNGLKVWLKADVGLLDANGNAITSENTNVHTWQDQSGNNLHATQSTTSLQPVVSSVNGVSSVYFSADRLDISSFESSASFTIFSVHKATGHGLVYERSINTNATNGGEYLYTATNYTIATRRNNVVSGYNYPNNSNWGVTNEVKVATHQFDGSHTGHTLRDDGISVDMGAGWGAGITSPETINQPLYIGARGAGGAGITGHICEILYYDRVLSPEEVSEVESYLSSKWGGSVAVSSSAIPSSLVLNLDANDTSSYSGSGTTWYDLSGNNNHGTLVNGPVYNDLSGAKSFNFSGLNPSTDSYVNIPHSSSLEFGGTFTVCAWIRPDDINYRRGIFSTRSANAAGSWQFELGWGYNNPTSSSSLAGRLAVTGVGTWVEVAPINTVAIGRWDFVVYTRHAVDDPSGKIYKNGTLLASGASDTNYTILDNTNDKRIAQGTSGTGHIDGRISMVRVYNTELSEQEILEIYNQTKSTYGY